MYALFPFVEALAMKFSVDDKESRTVLRGVKFALEWVLEKNEKA